MLKSDAVRKEVLEEILRRVEARIAETSNVTQGFSLLKQRGPVLHALDQIEMRAGNGARVPNRLETVRQIVALYKPRSGQPFDENEDRIRMFCVALHIWFVTKTGIHLRLGIVTEDQLRKIDPEDILAIVRKAAEKVNAKESEHS